MSHRTRFKQTTLPLPGFRDLVGGEVRVRRYLESKLADLFSVWGYEEIEVPLVERASSFSEEVIGGSPWPEWNKRGVFYLQLQRYEQSYSDLPEQEPALLVPEGTISVSRWLAKVYSTGLLSTPRKIFYVMPCFRNELASKLSDTKGRQFSQAGVEILGTNNIRSDLEVLLLAWRGFVEIGVPDDAIRVRLGSVSLFNVLCGKTGLDPRETLVVKDLLDTIAESRAGKEPERLDPSIRAVFDLLACHEDMSPATQAKWQQLTHTQAEELDQDFLDCFERTPEAVELNAVAASARELGINCVIDPSVVRSHEYYTGIVYEIDIALPRSGVLVEVAGGGRYNKLIGRFLGSGDADSVAIPAVGFAYGLERVATVFDQAGAEHVRSRDLTVRLHLGHAGADIVVAGKPGTSDAAIFAAAASERLCGYRVDVYSGDADDPVTIKGYADRIGARVVWV